MLLINVLRDKKNEKTIYPFYNLLKKLEREKRDGLLNSIDTKTFDDFVKILHSISYDENAVKKAYDYIVSLPKHDAFKRHVYLQTQLEFYINVNTSIDFPFKIEIMDLGSYDPPFADYSPDLYWSKTFKTEKDLFDSLEEIDIFYSQEEQTNIDDLEGYLMDNTPPGF